MLCSGENLLHDAVEQDEREPVVVRRVLEAGVVLDKICK